MTIDQCFQLKLSNYMNIDILTRVRATAQIVVAASCLVTRVLNPKTGEKLGCWNFYPLLLLSFYDNSVAQY
jgi:hypothetical protein